MVRVNPLEDELADAHGHRQAHILGFDSRADHVSSLRDHFGIERGIRNKFPATHLFAMACGVGHDDYVRRHTMIPLATPVPKVYGREAGAIRDWTDAAFHQGFEKPVDEFRLCMECVAADRARGRLSPFKRSHHMRGTNRCPWHGAVLHSVQDESPISCLPAHWIERRKIRPLKDIDASVPDQEWLRRYIEICIAMLNADTPMARGSVTERLIEGLDRAGLQTRVRDPKRLPSDAIVAKAGEQWIALNLPLLRGKRPRESVQRLDDFRADPNSARTSIVYASLWACFPTDPWTSASKARTGRPTSVRELLETDNEAVAA